MLYKSEVPVLVFLLSLFLTALILAGQVALRPF